MQTRGFLPSYLHEELQVSSDSRSEAEALTVKADHLFPGLHPMPHKHLLDHRHRVGATHLNLTSSEAASTQVGSENR